MKNSIECKTCHADNPVYGLICTECKAYLRERIFNLDLWHTLGLLIENPSEADRLIIQSEHKNFIFFIAAIVSLKLLIDSMFVSLSVLKPEPEFGNFFRNYFIVLGEVVVILTAVSVVFKIITGQFGISTRIKDNFALLIYSLFPYVFGTFFLLIIELTIFGGNIFSRNPSPFMLKETLAYVLTGFEVLLVLWSIFLSFFAFFSQTKNLKYSFIFTIFFNFVLYLIIFTNSYYLFK